MWLSMALRGVTWRYVGFCGVIRHCVAVCGASDVMWRYVALCGVMTSYVAFFTVIVALCGVIWRYEALCGVM